MPGLDPGIHPLAKEMDRRIKSGDDDGARGERRRGQPHPPRRPPALMRLRAPDAGRAATPAIYGACIPFAFMTAPAAGVVKCAISALAASGSFALAPTAAANTRFWSNCAGTGPA